MLYLTLNILGMATFDRLRGGNFLNVHKLRLGRHTGQLGMGVLAAYILHLTGWVWLYAAFTLTVTGMIGVNPSLAAAFTNGTMPGPVAWYQFGFFKRNILAAVVLRGLIWGLPLLFINPLAVLAFAIPYTVTPYLARWFFPTTLWPFADKWSLMEFVRGGLIGAALVLVS